MADKSDPLKGSLYRELTLSGSDWTQGFILTYLKRMLDEYEKVTSWNFGAIMSLFGQSSGDFKETSGRIQLFHVVTRNSVGALTPDAFTQANPGVVTTAPNLSSTLANINGKRGVLGSSIAFTRPDYGNNYHGGPVLIGGLYSATLLPLGFYLNDSLGNAFENTPGVASQRGPYVCGSGSCVGLKLYETKQQIGGSVAVTYSAGQRVYASVNGLVTNRITDAYEYNVVGQNDPDFVTVLGVVKRAPDATNDLLVIDLRV